MIDCVAYYFIIPKNIGKNFNDKKIPKVRKNRPAITEIWGAPQKLDFLSVAVLMAATLFLCSQGW